MKERITAGPLHKHNKNDTKTLNPSTQFLLKTNSQFKTPKTMAQILEAEVAVSYYGININHLPFFRNHFHSAKYVQKLKSTTNTNYKVTTNTSKEYICRFPRTDATEHGQIQEIIYFNSVAAHRILNVAPKPVSYNSDSHTMITEYVRSTPITIETLDLELLQQLITTIRQFHNVSDTRSLKHELLPADNISPIFQSSKSSNILYGYDLEDLMINWTKGQHLLTRAKHFQELMQDSMERYSHPLVACHNDLSLNNFLIPGLSNTNTNTSRRILIIDWEWSGIGDRLYDMAYFCIETNQDEQGVLFVLQSYLQQEPTPLERARFKCWMTWCLLLKALKARTSAMGSLSLDDDYDEFADNYLLQFETCINSPPMTSTEYESGYEEILQMNVDKKKQIEKKIRLEKEHVIEKERRRLLREEAKNNSDSD